ncbi:MAG TPA: hypothetical protein VJI46_04110 [Candidatus Nanoarchaeia archaeon]|nr:hypothetical protein [Candidatus Nanoarchaeia archaeon]
MKYKLVCFDVDGTLIDGVEFSWTHLHNYFNVDIKDLRIAINRIKSKSLYT